GSLVPMGGLATSPTMHRELRIKTIHSSLAIEGNSLSEEVVSAILDGKRVLGAASDIREVQNADRAYAMLAELDPTSVSDLLRAHGVMMDGLIPEAGCFRAKNVGVYDGERLIHAGTPAAYVPEVVADLFAWVARTDLHPLVASCVFHYEFEFIHPFSDGNGRMGRLWHTLLLSRWRPVLAWLPIESVILDRQAGYYAALAESNYRGSCECFVTFMLEVIRDAMRPYAYGYDRDLARREKACDYLRHDERATVSEIAGHLGCSKRTAERLMAELKADGIVAREGSARAGRWVVRGL
ncbi:MAG: Fic family protein, partial [Coriobacteriia bacterium]|nr:Fic family protein [Coriobacteriia bacterium]